MRRIRRSRKKYNKKFLIVLLLLCLGIGFSTTATTLYLSGSTDIGKNTADFNVMFTKAKIGDKNVTGDVITDGGTKLVISTNDLSEVDDSKAIDYVITNISSEYDADVTIACSSENSYDYYSLNNSPSSVSISAKDKTTGRLTITLTMAKSEDDNIVCTLSNSAGERTSIASADPRNSNIVEVMKYDQDSSSEDYCVAGDEDSCLALDTDSLSSYVSGTIVKYKVNSSTVSTFYVLHDDGDTITMQYDRNLFNSSWYLGSDENPYEWGNTRTPTFISELEEKTNGWTNVNQINYSIGDESSTLGFSQCTSVFSCTINGYSLSRSGVRARIATITELAKAAGGDVFDRPPTYGGNMPTWMYNYTEGCSAYGCTKESNDGSKHYYTLSVGDGSGSSQGVYSVVGNFGMFVSTMGISNTGVGFRPVIEINK